MKNFIIKNKWLISTIVVILLQLQKDVVLDQFWSTFVQIAITVLTVFQQRVDLINQESVRLSASRKSFAIQVSIHKMLLDMFREIPSDFKKENITWRENIPSHLLIGGGILFLLMPLQYSGVPLWILLSCFSFFAFFTGGIIEFVQVKFFEGITNNRDIRWTWYGYFLFIPLYFVSDSGINISADILTAALMFVVAFVLHFLNRQ